MSSSAMLTADAPLVAGVDADATLFFANSDLAAGKRERRKSWRSPLSIPTQLAG